jgi:NADH dehydrogenase/NADH:ubiquinone oxidoreductase subunit G
VAGQDHDKRFRVEKGTAVPLPGASDLALREERAANATGARLLGFTEHDALLADVRADDALLILGDDLTGVDGAALPSAGPIVYLGTTMPAVIAQRATVVLPIANTLEEEGTFTNLRGRVQRFLQARSAPGVARPAWYVLADLVAAAGGSGTFFIPGEVFTALAASLPAFAGLDYTALGLCGLPVADGQAAGVSAEVSA